MVFTTRGWLGMVGSPPRDNGKVPFSITVVAGTDIGTSAGGASGSQRAATWALGCGALAATGTNSGIGASDADCTGVVGKLTLVTGGGWIGSMEFPCAATGASANAGRG